MTWSRAALASLLLTSACAGAPTSGERLAPAPAPGSRPESPEPGSAIFVHPDGAGVAHWGAARLVTVGPDGRMAWDRLERIGVYRGHMTDSPGASSHGGATAHAYGVKVPFDSYGMRGTEPLTALSGEPMSVLEEARTAGLATALINSGHIAEPGTGVYAASATSRGDVDFITRQIIESGVDILLSSGEILLLPEGEKGRFGVPGVRKDTVNLIERARELGYEVVYTRDELAALPDDTRRVLGVFGPAHSFNDQAEESLARRKLPMYMPTAPSVAEMTDKALRILEARGDRFLMVVEEEGSDNFANHNNAAGVLEALTRADAALQVALDYVEAHPRTLLLTTADSDAGGMEVWPVREPGMFERPLPPTTHSGAGLDGRTGTGGFPFVAEPDARGERLRFGVAWAAGADLLGGIVARAHGLNADWLPVNVDNTDIYRMLYATMFGRWLP
jgi:alkaline phosphatase